MNNILIDNKHLEIKTQKEKDYLLELSDKVKMVGLSTGYFLKNGDNGWLKLSEKGIDLKDSKKKFEKGSNQKFEWTFDRIISYFKNNKIVVIILVLIIVFFGATKLISEFSKAKENLESMMGNLNWILPNNRT